MFEMISKIVLAILKSFTNPEKQKKFVATLLDACSKYVEGSENTLDDKYILPLIDSIRDNFDIPHQHMSGG
jgi:hypothetical protein